MRRARRSIPVAERLPRGRGPLLELAAGRALLVWGETPGSLCRNETAFGELRELARAHVVPRHQAREQHVQGSGARKDSAGRRTDERDVAEIREPEQRSRIR